MREAEVIERAVANLPPEELAEFAAWFDAYTAESFDAAVERDAMSGALDGVADAALRDFREGKARELSRKPPPAPTNPPRSPADDRA